MPGLHFTVGEDHRIVVCTATGSAAFADAIDAERYIVAHVRCELARLQRFEQLVADHDGELLYAERPF